MFNINLLLLIIPAFIFKHAHLLLLENSEGVYVSKTEFNALQSKVSALEADITKEKTTIAFVAELTTNIVNPTNNVHIIFDHSILNIGNNYTSRHGVFVAPIPGVYHFAVEITAPPQSTTSHSLHVRIMKKNEAVAVTFVDGNTNYFLRRTASTILQLNTGDDVWCQTESIGGSNTINGGNTYSMFSGFLIRAV
ncbi:complement C1q subcomponent subunit B-like [Mytilus trossulus]|uniref:complement C1q subcomponent subunit B-like n=1 Tax=Mytilus trossulus TaxID=6551 RepID=UPI003004EF17